MSNSLPCPKGTDNRYLCLLQFFTTETVESERFPHDIVLWKVYTTTGISDEHHIQKHILNYSELYTVYKASSRQAAKKRRCNSSRSVCTTSRSSCRDKTALALSLSNHGVCICIIIHVYIYIYTYILYIAGEIHTIGSGRVPIVYSGNIVSIEWELKDVQVDGY